MIAFAVVLASVLGSDASAAYAAAAVAHHHRADAFERKGDLDAAIAEMRELVTMPTRHNSRSADLQLDAFGRLSELLTRAKRPAEAEAAARDGLKRAQGDTALVARLWVALGDALEPEGKEDAAMDAYQRAIDISRRLIDATLTDGGTR